MKIKRKQKQAPKKTNKFLWGSLIAIATLLIIGGAFIMLRPTPTQDDQEVTTEDGQVIDGPRLAVDQTTIDEGYIKLNRTIESTFNIKNVGNKPLKILGEPEVQLVEGCWPPRAVIGTMTLDPGQETTLSLTYMMHAGMDGPHEFAVHLKTNDPLEPEKLLAVKSDWGP